MSKENDEVKIKPLLTVKQISKIVGLSEYSVRRYLKASKIKGLKIGKAWRMTFEDINQWLVDCQLRAVKEIQEKEKRRKAKGAK